MAGDIFANMKSEKQTALLLLTRQIIDPDAKKMTYAEIAEQAGVSERQLFRWRTQDKEFAEARKELVDSYADEIIADAFGALKYQVVRNRNVKAAEVLLKSRGMLVDRKEVQGELKHEVTDMSTKDNDALLDELEQLRRKLGDG